MLLKSIRRMHGLCFKGQWRWTQNLLLVVWLWLLAAAPPKAHGYFLGDTKAVLNGCEDHWTLQDRAAMPLLFQMTVCVDIRVVVPGAWVAFSYSSVHAPRPELGLEGDDEALYGWLLRVRHRFPLRLSPTHWHRVCLRRDVLHNSFSLEVNGITVAERTVIAHAIPPSGSLWLGCSPRDRPPGATLGAVELYLFRMWPDLADHGFCEDGTVIGWNAQYWGLTSPKARQIDPNLPCDHRRFRRRVWRSHNKKAYPAPKWPIASRAANPKPESQLVHCNITKLCSDKDAYFWMSISVEANGGNKNEEDVKRLVSNVFGCQGDSMPAKPNFCQGNRQLQVVQVNCKAKSNISKTTCDVVLQLSHAISACELQYVGVSALQQAGDKQIQARIIGEVERVGRDLCEGVVPSDGSFVRCTSTSSQDNICQGNKHLELTCSLIGPNSNPVPQQNTESCSGEAPRFCDCTAFCNSSSQFFAIRININSASVNVNLLRSMLSRLSVAKVCMSGSMCQDIAKYYQGAHLECHGTQQRLYSCMVILEMSGPVSNCYLSKLLQELIDSNTGIGNEKPLTRMVVCGHPGLPVHTLLTSNLTWVGSDLLTSDVCKPDPTLLKCAANETLAVLLTDSCPPTTQQSTTQPSTQTRTPEASPPFVTNTTGKTYTTAENTAALERTNATQGTAQTNTTTPLATINSTLSSTAQPVLQTSLQNKTVTLSNSITIQNTTSLTPTEGTQLQNTTTAHQNTPEVITLSSVNSTLQSTPAAHTDSTLNTITLSPNHTTVYNVTTDNNRYLHNGTIATSNPTISTFTTSPKHTVTPSPNNTTEHNVTTVPTNYTTASNNYTTEYNVTTAEDNRNIHNDTIATSNPTISNPNPTAEHSLTTANDNLNLHNDTIATTNPTISTFTTSPKHTAEHTATTVTTNYTTEYSITTADDNRNLHNDTIATTNPTISTFTTSPKHTVTPSPNHKTEHNVTTVTTNYTTASNNYTTEYSLTTANDNLNLHNDTIATTNPTINTFTTSPKQTVDHTATTVTTNYTTEYSISTANDNLNLHNDTIATSNPTISTFTTSPKHTVTPSPNNTTEHNVTIVPTNYTTASNNYTTEYSITTADDNGNIHNDTIATSNPTISNPNPTAEHSLTTANDNLNLHNDTIATTNPTISTFTTSPKHTVTPSPNHKTEHNVTTVTTNYTTASNNYTTEYNVTTADNNRNLHNNTNVTGNPTINTFTTSPKQTADHTATTVTTNYTAEYSITTADDNRNLHNDTNVTSNPTISTFTTSPKHTVTPSPNNTTEHNVTTVPTNYTTASNNYTTEYNVTTTDNNRNIRNDTIATTNPTISTFTTSPKHTAEHTATTVTTNYTTEYSITTANDNLNLHNDTIATSNPTISTFTTSPNYTTEYNLTTADNNWNLHNDTNATGNPTISTLTTSPKHTAERTVTTVTTNYTTEYSITTANDNLNLHNDTIATSNPTISTFTTSPNYTTEHNVTTAGSYGKQHNTTITMTNTTVSTLTASQSHIVVYNVTTATKRNLHNAAATTSNTTISTFTASSNHTVVHNVTVSDNYMTESSLTAVTLSPNDTTQYNVTTAEAFTTSPNHTILPNVTTSNKSVSTNTTYPNHIVVYNATTATNNYTTEYNITTGDNNSNTTSNKSVSTIKTSPNHTVVYNATTATDNYTTATNNYTTDYNLTTVTPSPNDTTKYNLTTAEAIVHNGTITTSKPSPNYTVVYNVTTVSKNDTTAINITTTTVSSNKTATDNVTTSSIRETSQITTAPYENMTMSTASTKNLTVDSMTPVVHNTSKPTVAPPNNQTGNHTTVRVTQKITTTTNSTTAATGISPIINHNESAGINLNLSSTTISLTADFNRTTKGPGVNLTTTPAKVSLEHIATTPTTTATSTIHGPLSSQINLTTEKVSLTSSTTTLQTTIFASTTTSKPGTGPTSTNPAETTESQEAQEEQANELLDQTQDASQLNSSQVAQLVGQLEKLLDSPTVSQAVGQKAIEIISNLMEGDSLALSSSANKLIRTIDELGLKLVVTSDSEIISSNSLVLAVRTVDGNNFPSTSVNIFSPDNVELRTLSRSHYKRPNSALGSVFLPSSLTSGLSPWEQHQANRVQFTFYTTSALFQDAALNNQTIVSPVLGSSVANLSISNLSENIEFTIQNINPIHANNSASCVYWDSTLNDGGGGWSSAGCFLVNATPEDTTCSCNHLTSFAILLDLSREEITDHKQAQILTFITYIGCGISAVFLAVTLLTYLSFEKLLRDIPAKILVQLCMSLLLLNLVFLLDGWLVLNPAIGLCISTAFFLHYFLLTSFTWAGLEALHMYLSVIQVFTPYLSRYMLKFSLMGWGIPLVVVIVVISVDKDNYGLVTYGKYTDGTSDDFCWLRNDIAFYVGVVAYFVLIFALCLLVFIMVMVQLARIKKQNPQNQSPNRGVMTDVRSIAGLVILLGLTWGFALFAWGPLYLPFVYLFSIFNSLQGFLVFVFHCAVKENVRRQWRTYLCCGRLRLAENSEWSRTATQNTRNMSVGKGTTSAFHLTSRSSSMISDGTSSIGSVFADSGISDGSSNDVILNEIHRRNLSLQGEA